MFLLKGSVAIAGEVIRWLRDNLGIIKEAAESGIRYYFFNLIMIKVLIEYKDFSFI